MKRGTVIAVLGFILLTQYVNCSSYSNSIYEGGSASVDDSSAFQGLRVTSGDVVMACYEDHIQVGGPCNDADSKDHYIQYWLTRDREQVYWGVAPPTDHLTTKCVAGRFYAIVPKPNDAAGLGTTGKGVIEYQMNMQMYTLDKEGTGWEAGTIGPSFTFAIQKNANCGG